MIFAKRQSLIPLSLIEAISTNEWLIKLLSIVLPKVSPDNSYLTLNFFKDGIHFKEGDAALLENYLKHLNPLTELPASFRITNVQLCSPEILDMIKILESKFEKMFTCNLYYTPGQDRNCFSFHSDFQITYVCQLRGKKEWLFPVVENKKHMFYFKETPGLKEIASQLETEKILLEEGNQLFVPNSLVHCVQIKDTGPSLHLTFGSQEHTQDTAVGLFLKNALKGKGFEESAKMPVAADELFELVEAVKSCIANSSTEDFVKQFTQKMFTDNLKASKYGRFYKQIP